MAKRGFDYGSVGPLFNDLTARGFSPVHAAAIAGNFAHESGPRGKIDYAINEMKPTVKGSRGGFGAAQWTGPRRRELEAFAKQQGLPVGDRETQMKYFDKERTGSEKRAFDMLGKTNDVNSATRAFMKGYERPGVPALSARQTHARNILEAYNRGDYKEAGAPQTQMAKADAAPIGKTDFGKGIPANGGQTPPMNPQLQPAPTQMASNAPQGSVLNRINPKDPSGPLLSADGKPPAQLASIGKNDFAGGVPNSGMQAPSMNPQLQQPEPQLAQAPLPPSRPEGLDAPPMQLADAPMPPSRPAMPTSNPSAPVPVEVAFSRPAPSTPHMASMASNEPTLHAPMGGGGGVEGMAAPMGGQPQMGGDMGGEFSLAGLFGDAMGPQQQDPFMMADAGFGGGFDAGGGFGDLGSLFGGLFG